MSEDSTVPGADNTAEASSMDAYLEERAKLDAQFANKFTKFITVMFTDLKGSTTIAESEGDMVSRMLIKSETDLILPAIKENNGIFVKSIGDGTLSYFENALDALRAAVCIQKGMDALNMSKKFTFPVLMRVGMHTGKCVVEEHDIYGDVVNTASRFESAADSGGILISEDTYNALTDKSEIYCRFDKQVILKGKKEPCNAYKAFWNPREIELDKTKGNQTPTVAPTSKWKLALLIAIPLLIVLALALWRPITDKMSVKKDTRSIEHSVTESR